MAGIVMCGLVLAILFVSRLQSQGCVQAPNIFSVHTLNIQLVNREEDICCILQKAVYWIRIAYPTFKCTCREMDFKGADGCCCSF